MSRFVFITFFLPLLGFSSEIDVKKIVKKIEMLQHNKNISSKIHYNVYDPFATAKPILKQKNNTPIKLHKDSSITIETILNNKVLIAGKWLSVGDKINGATIKSINKNNIIIYKNNRWIKVSFKRKKDIINIKRG